MPEIFGSEWVLVGPLAFKACVGRLLASGVGSIPTRSRHLRGGTIGTFGSGVPSRLPRVRRIGCGMAIAVWLGWIGAGAVAPVASAGEATRPQDKPAEADSVLATPRGLDSPTAVMARSLLVPGWGQAKNGAWWKAILVAGIEGAFLERIAYEDRMADRYAARASGYDRDDPRRVPWDLGAQRHRNHRRDFIWWTGICVFLSMGDAYTDAHLKHFDVRLDPDEATPAPGGGESDANGGLRLQIGFVTHW